MQGPIGCEKNLTTHIFFTAILQVE
jgi:hypothetical protein